MGILKALSIFLEPGWVRIPKDPPLVTLEPDWQAIATRFAEAVRRDPSPTDDEILALGAYILHGGR